MERRGDWVEIVPQFFEFRMMEFDLWENHAQEVWDALLPLAQTQVFGAPIHSVTLRMGLRWRMM